MSVTDFLASIPFTPDDFQLEALQSIYSGRTVVVTAPTGAGKTLIAEGAVFRSIESGKRAFYTTPIKALSNQKFGDLIDVYGADRVGLLTGDNVINGDADVVVMTTEVLRNMIYARSDALDRVEAVILDEVHYLQDRFRGAVWEEVIIHAPEHIQMVALSATIANADEFADWIEARRGPTDLIITSVRPVPLYPEYMIKDRNSRTVSLLPMFTERGGRRRPNARIEQMLGMERGRHTRFVGPRRSEIIETLLTEGRLPAIFFVFSRAGCEAAALAVLESGLRMTSPEDREEIRRIAEERTAHLTDSDLSVLDYGRWISTLEVGAGAHHAGMVPAFKETVEELFSLGLLSVVFATETLALGINMPARTVVLESLSKYNGETHELLQPGDFTQLTGRAGRRGIDTVGYGVVIHSRYVPFGQVTEIASVGSHALNSSFRPTYNMAANLIDNYDEAQAVKLLAASFAQFQWQGGDDDRPLRLEALERSVAELEADADCERGSVEEFVGLIEGDDGASGELRDSDLEPGDVFDIPSGSRAGRYVMLKRVSGKGGRRLLVLGSSGRVSTLGSSEVVAGSDRAGRIELPVPFTPRDRRFRAATQRRLRAIPHRDRRRSAPIPDHPVATCPDVDDHTRAFRRLRKERSRAAQLVTSLRQDGVGLVEEFRSIVSLLEDWNYVDEWTLAPRGQRLRFIYNELDLLISEAIERGLFWNLNARELAAMGSVFVYEPRRDESPAPAWPTAALSEAWEELDALWSDLVSREQIHRLPRTRRPDPGMVRAVHAWAGGAEFDDLADRPSAPGDFVRVARQLVDLLRQIRDAAPELAGEASVALKMVDRGIVAAQGSG